MKHMALFFGLTLLSLSSIIAQDYKVSGQLKDAETGDPLLYSYVHAVDERDSIAAGGITDEKGFFKLELDRGFYRFAFSRLGYSTDTTKAYRVSVSGFLDVFKLQTGDHELDEVVVEESSDKYYFDRDEQIVTSKMKKGAADTYDVLSKVNGLYYDRYNNTITVDNDDNIIILVNSLEKDMSYIQNISPDRLKKVEIIRSPSGKYALEGYSAVVNILLKDDYRGVDASLSHHSVSNFFKRPENPLMIANNTASLNLSDSKYNAYLNYRHFYQNFYIPNTQKRFFGDTAYQIFSAPEYLDPNNMYVANSDHRVTAGLDYFMSPKHSLSYEVRYRNRPYQQNIMYGRYITESNLQGDTVQGTYSNLQEEGYETVNNSLFYIGEFDSRNKVTASYAFSRRRNDLQNTLKHDNFERIDYVGSIRNYSVFNLEYNHTFSKKLQTDLGYGLVWNDLNNNYNTQNESVTDEGKSFNYRDIRHQTFAYFTYKPSDKFVAKAGAAAENSRVRHQALEDNRYIVLPHGDISYKPLKQLQMTLKYRANAQYPYIDQVNPYGTYEHNGVIMKGNPDLKPAVRNSVSLRINGMGGLISAEPYYIFTDDYIINEITKNDEGIYESIHQNAGLFQKKGVKANLNLPFLNNFMLQSSADFFNLSITYNGETRSTNQWTCGATFIYRNAEHNTIAGLIYQNRLREYLTWDGVNYGGNDFWALMIKQPLFNQSLNLELIYSLPTDFLASYEQGSYVESSFYTEYDSIRIDVLKSVFMFKLSYRFSRGESIRKVEKNIDLEEGGSGGLF